MKNIIKILIVCSSIIIALSGCSKVGDSVCGGKTAWKYNIYSYDLMVDTIVDAGFNHYTIGSTTSLWYYTRLDNICTKQNPEVTFMVNLRTKNDQLSNPFTIDASTATCGGVQDQKAILKTTDQYWYISDPSIIGMNQCYGGLKSGTVYPCIKLSFASLGSYSADSGYVVHNVQAVQFEVDYSAVKD